jgi:hypothetical protein
MVDRKTYDFQLISRFGLANYFRYFRKANVIFTPNNNVSSAQKKLNKCFKELLSQADKQGITAETCPALCGLTSNEFKNILRGKKEVQWEHLVKLSESLELTVSLMVNTSSKTVKNANAIYTYPADLSKLLGLDLEPMLERGSLSSRQKIYETTCQLLASMKEFAQTPPEPQTDLVYGTLLGIKWYFPVNTENTWTFKKNAEICNHLCALRNILDMEVSDLYFNHKKYRAFAALCDIFQGMTCPAFNLKYQDFERNFTSMRNSG